MRLLITTDTVGGVWTYTRGLTEGLLSRGHDVLLVSMGRAPSLDQKEWARRTARQWRRAFSYHPTDHPLEWMQQNLSCYLGAEDELLDQIDRFCPDLLHLNQFCFGALPTSVPKVVVAHSDVMSWSHACRGRLPQASPWYAHYLHVVRAGLSQADAVVAPTRWMLDALCRNYRVPSDHAVIANGLSLTLPARTRKRKMQAVTIGRVWDEGKNVRMLEEVISPMPLLVAGELALEDEPAFASSRLRLLGSLSEQETLALFAESAIYVVTSLYEPFGLAPLEAALSGCAIIAHDIPSLREVWAGSALYFRDAAELSQHLHQLEGDAALLAHAASGARARARALYSQDVMIERYLELYAALGAPVLQADHISIEEQEAEHA